MRRRPDLGLQLVKFLDAEICRLQQVASSSCGARRSFSEGRCLEGWPRTRPSRLPRVKVGVAPRRTGIPARCDDPPNVNDGWEEDPCPTVTDCDRAVLPVR